jgi:anti-sigma-K factor RskA
MSPPIASTTGSRHTNPEDLVLYAMQLLPTDEAAVITRHVEHCAECRHELARIHGDLATTAFTADLQTPPVTAKQRLLKQVAREKKVIPISQSQPALAAYGRNVADTADIEEEEVRPRRNVAAAILGWTGWAVAAGLAFATATLYRDRDALRGTVASQASQMKGLAAAAVPAHQLMETLTDPEAMRVTLTLKPVAKPQPIGRATYSPANGSLLFLANNLEPLQMYKVYELWLIPADGHDPIPAGTFHPDDHGNASLIMPDLPKGVAVKGFGVTVEDDGGSQTPTLPIVMSGN